MGKPEAEVGHRQPQAKAPLALLKNTRKELPSEWGRGIAQITP